MIPAAAYLRVSTKRQAKNELPIDGQREAIARYAAAHGFEIVAEYEDGGISATLGTRKRGALRRMVQDAQAGRWRVLLTWDDSRIARNRKLDGWIRWEIEEECRVPMIAVSTPEASDLETALRAIVAAEMAKSGRAATRRGVEAAWHRGRRRGSAPFGYRWEGHDLVPTADAPRVVELFRWADSGAGVGEMARRMNWSRERVTYVLRSPAYAGGRVRGRRPGGIGSRPKAPPSSWLIRWDAHEAIVSRETWDRVQSRLDRHKRFPGEAPHLGRIALSGLLWHECGGRLALYSWCDLPSGRAFYYRCRCGSRVTVKGLTGRVVAALAREAASKRMAEAIAAEIRQAHDDGAELGEAAANVARLTRARDQLIDVLASGTVTDTRTLAAKLQSIQIELAAAEQRARNARGKSKNLPTAEEIRATLLRIAAQAERLAQSPAVDYEARDLLHARLDRIVVGANAEVTVVCSETLPGRPGLVRYSFRVPLAA